MANESTVTCLGKDLDKTGYFDPDSMEYTFETLKRYSEISKSLGLDPSEIIATATEASRVAKNAKSFFERVKSETGINVHVISSAGEAYYSTKGITFNSEFDEDIIHIMDIGGASTELITFDRVREEILHDFSLPLGAVRLTNWKEEGCLGENIDEVLKNFSEDLNKASAKKLYCVAGTMTSVGNMYLGHKDFVEKEVHGLEIMTEVILDFVSSYKNNTTSELLESFPFLGKRAETILGGLSVARIIFDQLSVEVIEISTYGLRYGTLESGGIKSEYIVK